MPDFDKENTGAAPVYTQVARQLGELLVQENITLVYGGGKVGLMGDRKLSSSARKVWHERFYKGFPRCARKR